jgi:hypothetical protein
MKKLFVLFSLALIIVFIFTCSEPNSPTIDNPNGIFKGNITLYDSLGTNPIKGNISLIRDNTTDFGGTWSFQNGQSGKLTGTIDNIKININLNPNMIDDNTFLIGDFAGNTIEGQWVRSGIMGVNDKGTFVAKSF